MSNGWAVRSKGKPYFAFVQADFANTAADANPIGNQNPFRMTLEVAIESMPLQHATADEIHRLFSYQSFTAGGVVSDLLGLGVTPSGRLVGLTPGAGVSQSGTGVVVADGITRTWVLDYNLGGVASLSLDGNEVVFGGGLPIAYPMASYFGVVNLFNSAEALTRCACRIRKASIADYLRTVTWAIDKGFDRVLAATKTIQPNGAPLVQNYDLTANAIDPPAPAPWGPLTDELIAGVADAYAWQVSTAYTRLAPPVTVYERTQV